MKHVVKGPEPPTFRDWKNQENEAWRPDWDSNFQNPEKQAVKEALVAEQGGLCAYCCRRIEATPASSHIEHVVPRHTRPDLALDYANFVASCPGDPDDAELNETYEPAAVDPVDDTDDDKRTCGHHKQNWHAPVYFIDPREPDCERAFSFTARGEIREAPDAPRAAASRETITRLNLNANALQRQRAAVIGAELDRLSARRPLRRPDVISRLDQLKRRGRDGTFAPFQPALLDILSQRAASLPAE